MKAAATSSTFKPSTLRALSAHLWRVICIARGLASEERAVSFVCYLGLREKLPTPLPLTFLGSPTLEATPSLSADTVCTGPLANVAAAIDRCIHSFNSTTLPALLHAFAFEDHPTRWCHGMFGRYHLALTSWQHNQLYDVQFVTGQRPRYVDGVVDELLDGKATVIEAGPASADLLVQLRLHSAAMEQVLASPERRRFRHSHLWCSTWLVQTFSDWVLLLCLPPHFFVYMRVIGRQEVCPTVIVYICYEQGRVVALRLTAYIHQLLAASESPQPLLRAQQLSQLPRRHLSTAPPRHSRRIDKHEEEVVHTAHCVKWQSTENESELKASDSGIIQPVLPTSSTGCPGSLHLLP